MHINQFKLTNFRNISQVDISVEGADIVALYGENGAGKTSVLEALALLSPGRGMHRSPLESHIKKGENTWATHTNLTLQNEHRTLGQSYTKGKRSVKVDDEALKSQSELSELGNVLWLTPKMDRLFMDGTAPRREFLDRLVFSIHPNHAKLMATYKHHMKSRLKLLKERADSDWITLEEQQAAALAEKIEANRADYLALFNNHKEGISLKFSNTGEDYLETWKAERNKDARFGKTHTGPHRLHVSGVLEPEGIKLEQTSTGQHKRAVLNILLTNARLIAAQSGKPPLLLMDEIAAHLDLKTRQHFFHTFTKLGSQIWLTGTEKDLFDGLQNCQIIHVQNGTFSHSTL